MAESVANTNTSEVSVKSQSRKYQITQNNYNEHGFTVDKIKELVMQFRPTYFCLAEEIGAEGTPHVHVYMECASPVRFGTVKGRFPVAHIEAVHGSAKDNRDYIRKEGKFADTDKAETRVEGSFYEWGELKTERKTKKEAMAAVQELVKAGEKTVTIIEHFPEFSFKANDIDGLRERYRAEEFRKSCRDVKVHYVYGPTGTGKTYSIYQKYPKTEICRITDYPRDGVKFDEYNGENVLVLDEFHSQIPLPAMLTLLDVYPRMLPARYHNHVACFTEVYIISNLPFESQYVEWQNSRPDVWAAFCRRITDITEFKWVPPHRYGVPFTRRLEWRDRDAE